MITVVTPTIPGREALLAECVASVGALGLTHLIGRDEWHDGPAAVRNRLLEQVNTDWVLFLDDDDVLYPNYVDVVTPHLGGSDLVYTSWHLTGSTEGPWPVPFDRDTVLHGDNTIPVTATVRTDLVRAAGGFDPCAAFEDHELWKALLLAGARFTYVPVITWRYRRLPGSRSEQ